MYNTCTFNSSKFNLGDLNFYRIGGWNATKVDFLFQMPDILFEKAPLGIKSIKHDDSGHKKSVTEGMEKRFPIWVMFKRFEEGEQAILGSLDRSYVANNRL